MAKRLPSFGFSSSQSSKSSVFFVDFGGADEACLAGFSSSQSSKGSASFRVDLGGGVADDCLVLVGAGLVFLSSVNCLPSICASTFSLKSAAARVLYFSLMPVPSGTPCLRKNSFAFVFPPACIMASCLSDQVSIVRLRTKLKCTPNPLWTPLHSRHIIIPYVTEAHCGFAALHSKQILFPVSSSLSCLKRSRAF